MFKLVTEFCLLDKISLSSDDNLRGYLARVYSDK